MPHNAPQNYIVYFVHCNYHYLSKSPQKLAWSSNSFTGKLCWQTGHFASGD